MQLDAEDDDQPFFKPSVVQTEPLIPKARDSQQPRSQTDQHAAGSSDEHQEPAASAATVTAELEE